MTEELPVLDDPELARAFGLERQRPSPNDAARARASARLLQALAPAAVPVVAKPSLARRVVDAVRIANPLLTAALGFALGVGTGVAVGAAVRGPVTARPPAPAVTAPPAWVATPSAAPVPPEPELPAPTEPSQASTAVLVPSSAPARSASASPSTAEQALAERLLLDTAYAALGQGQPAKALESLQQHARRFTEGALREEREALTIQCLHDLGSREEARRRALGFKSRYPNSLFAPRVERVLAPAASVTTPGTKKP